MQNHVQTWSDAQTYCREHHTDLAIFKKQQEFDVQREYCSSSKCWIGLRRDKNDKDAWRWSGGQAARFIHWKDGEPNNEGGIENCTFMHGALWFDAPCNIKFTFLCYEDDLILVKENKTWEEAFQHCRTLDIDGVSSKTNFNPLYNLPSIILSGNSNNNERNLVKGAQTDKAWIGLRFLAGHWLWVDGMPVQKPLKNDLPICPRPWIHCGTISKSDKLVQLSNCLERRNFFCVMKN